VSRIALLFGPALFAAWWLKRFEATLVIKLREWNFHAAKSFGLLGASLSVLALGWPLWLGLHFGAGPDQWRASLEFFTQFRGAERSSTTLTSFSKSLQGSSLYFRELLLHNRARVLAECGGQGTEAPWEKKRVCLILLFASTAEAIETARPVALKVAAARAAVLSSLDGLLRVLRVEGRDSELLPFFLNALAQVGLQAERDDLHKILFVSRLPQDQIQSLLVELRYQIERDLLESQRSKIPAPMILYLRSPLEDGI
jgi:hypothetical protein